MSNWNNFFVSIRKYLEYFRSCDHIPSMRGFPSVSISQIISEHELAGLFSWTDLATVVARHDPEARRQMYEDRQWNCIENVVGLLSCSIPLILKGKLYNFLAALAMDESASIHVWNCFLCEGICVIMENGKLSGIQQDLEEQECVHKVYNCSEGYLNLMKELFSHKTRPSTQQLAPHLQFISKSIVCQFNLRSYNDCQQMWNLVKLGLDCLYELLKMFYVTQSALSNKSSEIQLLVQLLNDTPLLRSLLNVILEGTNETKDFYSRDVIRDEAALSAIRLLYIAVLYRSALADAIRAVASSYMICSLEALIFSALPSRSNINCLALLFLYISENEYFIKHTYYVIKILRELCCQRPSLQKQIIQSIFSCQKSIVETVARLTAVFSYDVEVSHVDLIPSDIETLPVARVRGEIIRNLLEAFVDSIESDSKSANFAYLLLGFNLKDIGNSNIYVSSASSSSITCLYNFLEIVNILTTSDDPFSVSFCALYEPSLRLLFKLSTLKSVSSPVILRAMRSHYDLVFKLASSRVFRKIDTFAIDKLSLTNDFECATMILRKSIQCIILEIIALELSSLLRSNHIEQPRQLIAALLLELAEQQNYVTVDSTFATEPSVEKDKVVLWSLLEQSKIDLEELEIPNCNKFDPHKVDELLRFCVRKNSCNIEQFDIEYLNLLLNTEINSIVNSEIGIIREEARSILDYCAQHNAKNLLEGACIHLLSGWLSIINVLALHSPLLFIECDNNIKILIDALCLLKNYCFCVDTSVEINGMISSCMFRIVRSICSFYENGQTPRNVLRQTLFPIIHLLLQCLALPRYSKCFRFKLDIYGSILCVFDTCNRAHLNEKKGAILPANIKEINNRNGTLNNTSVSKADGDLTRLVDIMKEERDNAEEWSKYFESMTAEIVDTLSSDITYAPLNLKIAATSCLSDIIREDIVHSKSVAYHFVYSGAMACVLDTLCRVVMEFKTDKTKAHVDKCRKQVLLVKSLFSLFVRLAASEHGWTALINGKIFERLLVPDDKENCNTNVPQLRDNNANAVGLFRQLLETMNKI